MPMRMLGEKLTVVCTSHPHDSQDQTSTMFKYDDRFIMQAVECDGPVHALRKQALRVMVCICKVCGYVELYAPKTP